MELAVMEQAVPTILNIPRPVISYGSNQGTGIVAEFPLYMGTGPVKEECLTTGILFTFHMSLAGLAQSGVVVLGGSSTPKCHVFLSRRKPDSQLIEKALEDLSDAVRAIKVASPLPLDEDLDALLARAVRAQGVPSDTEAWARRIASDVCGLTD